MFMATFRGKSWQRWRLHTSFSIQEGAREQMDKEGKPIQFRQVFVMM